MWCSPALIPQKAPGTSWADLSLLMHQTSGPHSRQSKSFKQAALAGMSTSLRFCHNALILPCTAMPLQCCCPASSFYSSKQCKVARYVNSVIASATVRPYHAQQRCCPASLLHDASKIGKPSVGQGWYVCSSCMQHQICVQKRALTEHVHEVMLLSLMNCQA